MVKRLYREKRFLNELFAKGNIADFENGFFSQAEWEVHLIALLDQRLISFKPHRREEMSYRYLRAPSNMDKEDMSEEEEDEHYKKKRSHIDFIVDDYTAVEFRVETMELKRTNEVFGGMTAQDALNSDIAKLRSLRGTKYKTKWVIMIARSVDQIKILETMMRDYGGCWEFKKDKDFVAVLLSVDRGDCSNVLNRYRRGFLSDRIPFIMDPPECRQKLVSNFESKPEANFLSLLKNQKDDILYSLRDRKIWENHAEVLISKIMQCQTSGFSYSKKIRNIEYPGDKTEHVDFFLQAKNRNYAIELEVQVGPTRNLSGKYSVEQALRKEIHKLQNWDKNNEKEARWVVLILESTYDQCNNIVKWVEGRSARCPTEFNQRWIEPTEIGTKDTRDYINPNFEYPQATIWVQTTHQEGVERTPFDALLILVCIEKTVGGGVCTQSEKREAENLPIIDATNTTAPSISMSPSVSMSPSIAPSSGYYQIKSSADDTLCMSLTDRDISKNINLWTCNGHDYQKWIIDDNSFIRNYLDPGKCLEATEDLTSDNKLYLTTCGFPQNATRQLWTISVDNELENQEHQGNVIGIDDACNTIGPRSDLVLGDRDDCAGAEPNHQKFIFYG